ncbi:MAG: hypothetical protein KC468_37660 [Myxococcales bacterium]|nr:hypothetical protein [Myxococcales bacterium]
MPAPRIDPGELGELVAEVLAEHQTIDAIVPAALAGLEARFPGAINPQPRWIFSKAGGLLGTMMLAHASLGEYIMLFGCPCGSEGFSGRHRPQLWDFVLTGELWTNAADELRAQRHAPGDCSYLAPGRANHSRLAPGTFLLEYARGPISTMLPFGLLEVATSTLDLTALRWTLSDYTRCVTRSLWLELRGRAR